MQKLLKMFFVAVFGLFMSFSLLHSESLVEGKDYLVLQQPLEVPKNSIVEIFNIGCPHCANMSKVLPNLFAVLPEDVVFLPYHIQTAAPFSEQASEVLAVALELDKGQKLSPKDSKSHFHRASNAFFDANFKERKFFNNKESFVAYGLETAGIPQDVFKKTLESAPVQTMLKQWKESTKNAQIQGVPTFIINGKYLILSQALKSEEDFIFKVDDLLGR